MNRHLILAVVLGAAVFVLGQVLLHLFLNPESGVSIALGALVGIGSVVAGHEYYESRRSDR